jgi:alpha-1,6-mannosyltransferase
VARRRGIPLIAFYHSNIPMLAGRRLGVAVQKLFEWHVRQTYQRCDQVFAPSRYMCQYLHELGITHASVQPLGVDLETFSPARCGRDLRAELALKKDTRLLVFAGRFSQEKNIPILVDAFGRLGSPYHLLLVGGAQRGRVGNVTRLPYCRDNRELAGMMASADAVVHAGTHETFGLVVLEAMACGRAVVGMRAGAIPELIDPAAGILADPHDDPSICAANLAAAIDSLYERDLEAIGAAARRHVSANYSWSRTLQALMGSYQEAIGVKLLPIGNALARME